MCMYSKFDRTLAGVIYILKNDFGLYKIGLTRDDVEVRTANIESSSGVPTKVLDCFTTKDLEKVENVLHSHHSKYRTVGEWFWHIDWNFVSEIKSGSVDIESYKTEVNIDPRLAIELKKYPILRWRDAASIKQYIRSRATSTILRDTLLDAGFTKQKYDGITYWSLVEVNVETFNSYTFKE